MVKSPAVRDIYMNGRHQHITYISTMQYVMDMGPDLRANVDYVFTLKVPRMTHK